MLTNSVALGVFAVVTVGIVATADVLTSPRIERERALLERRTLTEVLSSESFDEINERRLSDGRRTYVATLDGVSIARIIPARADDGYSGPIALLAGVRADGTLIAVRVLEHRETPGLGDRIEPGKSDWILTFDNRSLTNPPGPQWALRRDGGEFDALTGATITSRAVIRGVHEALERASAQHALLQEDE